ncbi:hypothetical protein [Methylobacterium sp. A54F]
MTLLERQNFYIESIERFKGGGLERLPWQAVRDHLERMLDEVPIVLHPFTPTDKVARGRKLTSANLFHDVAELLHPPKALCRDYGRCNRPRSPVLYAAIGYELVFSEIGAEIGDIIGLAFIRPRRELLTCLLGALDLYRRTEGHCLLAEDTKAQIKPLRKEAAKAPDFLFDAFISDYFGRVGSEHTYKLTSAYTDVIFSNFPHIDAIMYDSVDHKKGMCFAIKPDVVEYNMTVTDVQIVRVTNYLGYGFYDWELIANSKKISKRTIEWA